MAVLWAISRPCVQFQWFARVEGEDHSPGFCFGAQRYRQLGSQISMFQVDCEIG